MKGYISAREASYKWGVSERRVHQYCQAGRVPGVSRFGRSWVIPADAKKPVDPRRKHTDACTLTSQRNHLTGEHKNE